MAKVVYVQVRGVEKPARIMANKVEESGNMGQTGYKLLLKNGDTEVGRFGAVVDGWWIQDEE